jgi:hypothetical protein
MMVILRLNVSNNAIESIGISKILIDISPKIREDNNQLIIVGTYVG